MIGSGILSAAESAATDSFAVQPIFTRFARTETKIRFDTWYSHFRDVELQEADNFNGWTVGMDVTVPFDFAKGLQLYFNAPLYTEGSLVPAKTDQKSDVHGKGGVFDFPSMQLEWQFMTQEEHGWNVAVRAGAGYSFATLENDGIPDIYNHKGSSALGGLKFDRTINNWLTLAVDMGVNYYIQSDDLNPSGGGDTFAMCNSSVAVVFDPWKHTLYPAFELVYFGNFSDFNSVNLVPELIWRACDGFQIKTAFVWGLTNDGEDYGAEAMASFRF
ncbi:MAG: hypothetical protein R6V76_04130 [Desulfobacterales bacterium]